MNGSQRVLVIGASGHAKVVVDILEQMGGMRVVGLVDRGRRPETHFFGVPLLGDDDALPGLVTRYDVTGAIVAIGDNCTRSRVASRVSTLVPSLPFVVAIHPSVRLARGVRVGPGSVVMAGAVLNSDVSVGVHAIVNTGACVDHDSFLGDFSSLAPGVVAGGNVRIGAFAHVGIGAVILQGRSVGEQSVVGAGALVTRDIANGVVAYGMPARMIRPRSVGEPYL